MGSVLSGILGTQNNFQANTGGQNFGQAIGHAQTGINQNIGNQNNLAQALMAQMNGTGANPAQAMLNQATDNNIKQSTSMLASQKGINPGTAQRLTAENAANTQQQAAGQAATMGAQQQLAAQGELSNVYGQIGSEQQANQNGYQSALANNNSVNSGVAQANANASGQALGTIANAAGAVGGLLSTKSQAPNMTQANGISSAGMSNASTLPAAQNVSYSPMYASKGAIVPGKAPVPGDSKKNDIVPAELSPGEIVIPRSAASDPQKAKEFIDHIMATQGDAGKPGGFAEIAALKERIKALEKKVKK